MEPKREKKPCRRISDVIPAELTDTPIIGMTGRKEITVDGFRGIEEYSGLGISFRAGNLVISVHGQELVIKYMSLHTIVVGGEISGVDFSEVK